MARFLSDEWMAEMRAAAQGVSAPDDVSGSLGLRIGGAESRELTLALAGGVVRCLDGVGPDCALVIETDAVTASAIARSDLNVQEALAHRRLRIHGDPADAVELSHAVLALGDVFRTVRATTEFPVAGEASTTTRSG